MTKTGLLTINWSDKVARTLSGYRDKKDVFLLFRRSALLCRDSATYQLYREREAMCPITNIADE